MALTLNSAPQNIDNSGLFNISTDLTEDSTHVNLRVRADITVNSVIVATIEKPAALTDFEFYYILKALVPGITHSRGSGNGFVSGGSPLIAYTVLFTEVWETAGVTTTGATDNASGTTFKFVPAMKTILMSDYVLSGATSKFACLTLAANACKYNTTIPYEYWIVFFTESASVTINYTKNGTTSGSFSLSPADGWGVIQLNSAGLMSGVTSTLTLQASGLSTVLTVYVDTLPIAERTILEFVGITGGMEYLPFEGMKHTEQTSIRNYFSASNKAKKPLLFNGITKQKLATRFVNMPTAIYLSDLLYSEDVRVMAAGYVESYPVTVVTDSVVIAESEMFTNHIEIEYQ
jgi:hypothetical protein